jgi:hypothetical protein
MGYYWAALNEAVFPLQGKGAIPSSEYKGFSRRIGETRNDNSRKRNPYRLLWAA